MLRVQNESKVLVLTVSASPLTDHGLRKTRGALAYSTCPGEKKKCISLIILLMLIDSKFPRELKIKFNFIMQNVDCKLNVFFQRYLVRLPEYKEYLKTDGFVSAGILLIAHRFQLDYSVKFCSMLS